MADTPTILLADDETAITSELAPLLERSGFAVIVAGNGDEAQRLAQTARPDLIVLDILMPGISGREVFRRLRAAGNWTPVIMLTQVGGAGERAMSLEEGADDYLNKPFDPFELVARIRAVLRRARPGDQPLASARRLTAGPLTIERPARRAWLTSQELTLTTKAFAVLEYLMLHHGEVIRRERLLDELWGWDYPVATRAVDIRIAELRRLLQDDADQPRFIETVIGEGYRFRQPVEAAS
jgi:DNA-binding response OmpR family regulator